jgi:hypothetical protein
VQERRCCYRHCFAHAPSLRRVAATPFTPGAVSSPTLAVERGRRSMPSPSSAIAVRQSSLPNCCCVLFPSQSSAPPPSLARADPLAPLPLAVRHATAPLWCRRGHRCRGHTRSVHHEPPQAMPRPPAGAPRHPGASLHLPRRRRGLLRSEQRAPANLLYSVRVKDVRQFD